jgi:hypothetical protein
MTLSLARLQRVLAAAFALASAAPCAELFQFEVLGASNEWVVIRENIPALPADTAACTYPGLDPSKYVGVRVHFVRLTPEARFGRLFTPELPADSPVLYTPRRGAGACTSRADADRQWSAIVGRAKTSGVHLSEKGPVPVVLGAAVPAKACALLGGSVTQSTPCRRVFKHRMRDGGIEIGVVLTAIPEAPDKKSCQFVGHRLGAAIQVAGLDFGTMESGVAPGGFATHYDCRNQEFEPLRLYVLGAMAVLIGGFRGASIADRDAYPFILTFPSQPAP